MRKCLFFSLVWILQVIWLLGSQIQTVWQAFYKCNIIHRRKAPHSRKQLNICLPMGSSKWILICLACLCRFCFTYYTVFISTHKFFLLRPSDFFHYSTAVRMSKWLQKAELLASVRSRQERKNFLSFTRRLWWWWELLV